jgi:hypothetical protein
VYLIEAENILSAALFFVLIPEYSNSEQIAAAKKKFKASSDLFPPFL